MIWSSSSRFSLGIPFLCSCSQLFSVRHGRGVCSCGIQQKRSRCSAVYEASLLVILAATAAQQHGSTNTVRTQVPLDPILCTARPSGNLAKHNRSRALPASCGRSPVPRLPRFFDQCVTFSALLRRGADPAGASVSFVPCSFAACCVVALAGGFQ